LIKKGKTIGIDFTISNAIATANELAYNEAVKAKIQQFTDDPEYISFDGDDTCENCQGWDGWDGISHRCECGNRRVSWNSMYGSNFENMTLYAEAY